MVTTDVPIFYSCVLLTTIELIQQVADEVYLPHFLFVFHLHKTYDYF